MSIWTDLTDVDIQHERVPVDDVNVRVLRAGTGPDVICLHGTSGHLEAFTKNVVPLVRAGFTVHAIDMLGHGYTDKPDFDYTPPVQADLVAGYIKAYTNGSPHIIGESLGGWVAAWLASESPGSVEKVILVAPGGTAANQTVMDRIRTSTEAAVMTPDIRRTRERLELLMYNTELVTDELVDVRHRIYTQESFRDALPHVMCLQHMELRTQYLLDAERLGRVKAPTLLIWGRQNPFGKLDEADFISTAVPDCRLELFEECGHWPQYEKAELFNQLAIDFLTDK